MPAYCVVEEVLLNQLTLEDVIQKDNYVNASTGHLIAPPNWDQSQFRVILTANARRNQALVGLL